MRRIYPLFASILALPLAAPLGGTARAQVSQNIIFHSNLDEHPGYNDCWGYTAPNGDEYALLGATTGTAVINIVDPKSPYETGFIPGPTSTWRDIKTYQHYAYVTNETSGGIEIIDLADPESPVDLPNYTGINTAHNLYIDTTTGRLYTAGAHGVGGTLTGGTRILSLANPTAPVEVGSWETVYLHDVMVQSDRLYGSAINAATLYVLNVANVASITTLGTASGYPLAFTHNAWVTPDGNYVMTTDEQVGASCRMWSLSNLPAITQTGAYLPNAGTIPHNTHIDGNLAVISHYTIGMRVVDVSDPFNLVELGYYDTWPLDNSGSFNGCWGAFPFFQTNPNLILASDISTGLYVLEYKGPLGTLAGTVTESGNPTVTIPNAGVRIVETGTEATGDGAGQYSIEEAAGGVTLEVSAFAYQTANVPATITAGTTTTVDVQLVPVPGGSISGTVTNASFVPLPDAMITVLTTPLVQVSDGVGNYNHSSVPAGSYTVRVKAFGYHAKEIPVTVGVGTSLDLDVALNATSIATTFEAGAGGWTAAGSATAGQWALGDPEPTDGGAVQTGDDHTPTGANAWITGLLAGTGVGSNDVDNGTTILTSPLFDVTSMTAPRVSYYRWYVTGYTTNATTDFWVVQVSSNGGSTWSPVENTDQANPAWVEIDALIPVSNQIRFRFTAQDTGAGSITEAGLDDFMIYDVQAEPGVGAPLVAAPITGLTMAPAAPNPFRAGETARVSFALPEKGRVVAGVYDVGGRFVAKLVDGVLEAGPHGLAWNGLAAGRPAPAGVYFLRLETASGTRSGKMVLVR
jgi:choice-of-anchor B domain-containing protein